MSLKAKRKRNMGIMIICLILIAIVFIYPVYLMFMNSFKPFGDDELLPVVEKSLEKIKPMLALDGGGLTLLGIKQGRVYVQLQGACQGCASSGQTLKYGVERQLRIDIHPELEVVNILPGQEHEFEAVGE
jgi:Fe-S cluster biogenesis protein NfuA